MVRQALHFSSILWLGLVLLLASCGDDGGAAGGAGAGGNGTGGSGGIGSVTGSLGCTDGTLDSTLTHVDLNHDGAARNYELHVPPSYDGTTPMPLVLNFHGFTSNGIQQQAFSAMDITSDENGFIVAYPNGLSNSWNAGVCCGASAVDGVDDVGFTRAIVDDLGARGCIDLTRVYATGMSNGGFMSHRLACEASDIIAAIGPVAGVLGLEPSDCNPERPVPVVHFHGTADPLILYAGGGLVESQSVVGTFDDWVERNGCTDAPEVTFDQGMVRCETADECEAGASVTLCTVSEGGHCWPGQPLCPSVGPVELGDSTTDISANDTMWELFSTVTLGD